MITSNKMPELAPTDIVQLRDGRYGIVEISYMVGFNSPSYFSNCFKKQFGVLPKDFMQ